MCRKARSARCAAPLEHSLNYGRLLDLVRFENFDPMSRADGIVCVGYDEYRRVAAKFPEKNVIYLPNGVDPERFRTAPDPASAAVTGSGGKSSWCSASPGSTIRKIRCSCSK